MEGELFVREISFTYGGETDALFLNYISSLRKVQVRGEQSFQLNGDFDCETTPALDRVKLLTIQLNSESGIIFSSKSPGVAQLAVSELRLKPQTSIARLSYNPSKETPSLLLQLEAPEEKQSNLLELNVGQNPLVIRIEGRYSISSPGLGKSIEGDHPLQCIWKPGNSKYKFLLQKTTALAFSLPAPNQVNSERWFWKDLDVEKVQFTKIQRTSRRDPRRISTIEGGKIRMAGREITLDSQQFLQIHGKIKRLRNMQVDSEKGLRVRFAGKASKVQVGLDDKFFNEEIKATPFTKLPPEINSVLVSVISSIFVVIFTTLITLGNQSRD